VPACRCFTPTQNSCAGTGTLKSRSRNAVAGVRAETIDVNPEDGHGVTVWLQPDGEIHRCEFLPSLDLQMTVDGAPLAAWAVDACD